MIDFKQLDNRQVIQLIWGGALFAMGLAFIIRISEIMQKVSDIEHFASVTLFIRIAFYLMGILLIGGGVKKIYGILQYIWRSM